jgi:hypothetical protein
VDAFERRIEARWTKRGQREGQHLTPPQDDVALLDTVRSGGGAPEAPGASSADDLTAWRRRTYGGRLEEQ